VLGRWDLAAIGINQVIGSAIFLMPSQVAAQVGTWAPLAFLLAGGAMLVVALCFAEVSSRFEGTGGAYLYTRTAFGRFAGFEVGWMAWFTRATSQAAVSAGLTLALGFYWPALGTGVGRAAVLTLVTLGLGAITYLGIRQSSRLVNVLTVAKLVPLAVFIVVGLAHADPARLSPLPAVSPAQVVAAALLLIFVYGGFDVIAVPAGEASDPRRHVPGAFLITLAVVTTVFTLAQVVATMTVPELAGSQTPLADSAQITMGAAGALLVGAGSMLAMTGNIAGQVLAGSRYLYAVAEQGDLPAWFARIHPRFHTPSNATIFTTLVTLALALSGSFAALASAAAIARLLVYAGTCGATLALRSPRFAGRVGPPRFTVPLGPLLPVLGAAISVAVIGGASRQQLVGGGLFLGMGAVLFLVARRRAKTGAKTASGLDS
jgi:amino acid transporter